MSDRSGIEKAAILIISLGPKVASAIYRHLSDKDIERVTAAIARLGMISPEEKQKVLEEFLQMSVAQKYIAQGGMEMAQEILDNALGRYKANSILNRLHGFGEGTSFELLQKIEPITIANFLKKEHPQTIATVLSHMESQRMGPVLSRLPEELQSEVSYRVATMDTPNAEAVKVIEEVVNSYLSGQFSGEARQMGGTKKVADALNEIDPETWHEIIEGIEAMSQEVAQEIKNQMFVFEDIVLLDDKSVQELLKQVEQKDLALALKAASESIKDKIFGNMSKRAGLALKEDMEYMGPVRLTDVEAAQQKIVEVVRKLEEEGTVFVNRGGSGTVMVE